MTAIVTSAILKPRDEVIVGSTAKSQVNLGCFDNPFHCNDFKIAGANLFIAVHRSLGCFEFGPRSFRYSTDDRSDRRSN